MRELLAQIPTEDDELELEYPEVHQSIRDLAPGEYDSYEGCPTGNYIVCHLYYEPAERVRVSHWG